ncbi:MAG: formate--tetrahydrofolate ligase [Candidatus Aminicenantia bacterium]
MGTKIKPENIKYIAEKAGIEEDALELYGNYKAKISLDLLKRARKGKLILVSAMTPTHAGEGKTTVSIGLCDAFNRIEKKSIVALREPSLGPVFGLKGGATGSGFAQVIPAEDINLHFTGDMHAITSAHNLLSAIIDNHIHHEITSSIIDPRKVAWKRVLDVDDRALRSVVVGIGGAFQGIARETGFDITAASEVMAILCLSKSLMELKERLGRILVGFSMNDEPVFASQLKANGAMTVLLKDAIKPNLVQTMEGNPALVHGGPFANIAHGTCSVIAIDMALKLAEFAIVESGFGADLGAEKFFNIVVRTGQIPPPDACVIVATIRAIKFHGGGKLEDEEGIAIEKGFENLKKHVENIKLFGVPVIVALNRHSEDKEEEIEKIKRLCLREGIDMALCEIWQRGGKGGIELAEKLIEILRSEKSNFKFLYPLEIPIVEKINTIAKEIYGAERVEIDKKTRKKIEIFEKLGFRNFPVCIAKTPYSLSDDEELIGRPEGFELKVTDVSVSSGAGFFVVYCGEIITMPGLPWKPRAELIDIDENNEIKGIS